MEKIKDYLYNNLASLFWSSFLLVGGGIFISYYAHIGYLPDFDLKSSVTVLAAAAISALITVSVFLVILIMPGVFWGNTILEMSKFKSKLKSENPTTELLKCFISFSWTVGLAFGTVITFIEYGFWGFLPLFIFVVTICIALKALSTPSLGDYFKEVCVWGWGCLVCALLFLIPLVIVGNLAASTVDSTKGSPVFLGVMAGLFVIFVNVMAICKPENIKAIYYYFGLSLIALFMIFSIFDKFHRIPVHVMEVYRLGNFDFARLIIKEEQCDAIKSLEVEVFDIDKKCYLKDGVILSRLGKKMLIKKSDITFTVNSEDVLTWSVKLPNAVSKSEP